jgi:sulfate transport system permease protein
MKSTRATQEPVWVRYTLLTIGLGFLFFFLGLPLIAVFVEALAQGVPVYLEALKEPETRSAIGLTIGIALAVLPFNIVFGVAAAWAIAKFDFKGKSFLLTLIDLPFAVSPVVSGLIFVLLFGANSVLGDRKSVV